MSRGQTPTLCYDTPDMYFMLYVFKAELSYLDLYTNDL